MKKIIQEEVTLNSFVAHAGIASRRKAVELIEKGFVSVNGRVERNSAFRVSSRDQVTFKGKPIKPEEKIYILLNKPKGYISTVSDEKNRKTVMDLIDISGIRLYPVGRLDRATSGLLLFTNDGNLSVKLAHPRNKIEKVYKATLDRKISYQDIEAIREGLKLEDGFIKPDFVNYSDDTGKTVTMVLHSGKNLIIRRIFSHLNYTVTKLDRVQYANLTKKNLPQGKWRFLNEQEISELKKI